jgi:hypothetical protein
VSLAAPRTSEDSECVGIRAYGAALGVVQPTEDGVFWC